MNETWKSVSSPNSHKFPCVIKTTLTSQHSVDSEGLLFWRIYIICQIYPFLIIIHMLQINFGHVLCIATQYACMNVLQSAMILYYHKKINFWIGIFFSMSNCSINMAKLRTYIYWIIMVQKCSLSFLTFDVTGLYLGIQKEMSMHCW